MIDSPSPLEPKEVWEEFLAKLLTLERTPEVIALIDTATEMIAQISEWEESKNS